jgi:4-hydroxy-tetrahydrodipicolinate reductase
MGTRLIEAIASFDNAVLGAAVVGPSSTSLGRRASTDAASVAYRSDLAAALSEVDAVIDFSAPQAVESHVAIYARAGKPLLVGTTGLSAAVERELLALDQGAPVMLAPNTSIGVAVLTELVRRAAAMLPAQFDLEIVESHHKHKQDAPSGTALALGAAAAAARDQDFAAVKAVRAGGAARKPGEIGFASVRAGDIVGKHTVLFAGPGEEVSLRHEATDRAVFAQGAVRAALWLWRQPPGSYTMRDFIGF